MEEVSRGIWIVMTGDEIKAKPHMVFDYQMLNENTYKDQYLLPDINTILKKVVKSKVYSKIDLKSIFHQVAIAEESIPWTIFFVLGRLYEWIVMPFGLKNDQQSSIERWMNDSEGRKIF